MNHINGMFLFGSLLGSVDFEESDELKVVQGIGKLSSEL